MSSLPFALLPAEALPRVRLRGVRGARWALALLLLCPASVSTPAAEPAQLTQLAPVSADELERVVDTLQDDSARAKLVEQLRALIAAQRGAQKEKPPAAALFGQLSQQVDALSGEILAGAAMVVDAPRLLGWAHQQISDAADIVGIYLIYALHMEGGFTYVLRVTV